MPRNIFSISNAKKALNANNFELALQNYFICLYNMPQNERDLLEHDFLTAFSGWLKTPDNVEKCINLYQQVTQIYPKHPKPRIMIIRALISTQKHNSRILEYCQETIPLTNTSEDLAFLKILECNLLSLQFPQWHIKMLNDMERNEAFRLSIEKCVSSDVILDIGAGTGLLSIFASRVSKKVISIESNPELCQIAKEVIEDNGCKENIILHNCHSSDYEPEEKVDVIVSETLDCCIFGEQIISTFIDAHKRLTKPGATFIPAKATAFIHLFSCPEIYSLHAQDYKNIKYRSGYVRINGQSEQTNPYWCCRPTDFQSYQKMSESIALLFADFHSLGNLEKLLDSESSFELMPNVDGTVHGFAVHFLCHLDRDETICIDSSDSQSCWDFGIFLFAEPLNIVKGTAFRGRWKISDNRLDIFPEYIPNSRGYVVKEMTEIMKIRSKNNIILDESLDVRQILDLTTATEDGQVLSEEDIRTRPPFTHLITRLNEPDGSFSTSSFMRLEGALLCLKNIRKIIPNRVKIIGRLFKSDRIDIDARLNAERQMEVLKLLDGRYNLREYRDIRLDEKEDILICSEDFEIFDFELNVERFRQETYRAVRKSIEVIPNHPTFDGVLYNFEDSNEPQNLKNQTIAAFVFKQRVNHGLTNFNVIFSMYEGHILISDD